jgi:16S rRNA (guanine527-N7)-methyltransferase
VTAAPDGHLAAALQQATDALRLGLTHGQHEQLLAYLAALHKWNRAYNLSGLQDLQQMLTLHVVDSLTVLPFIDTGAIADVGTGAGLPGLVLAICRPDLQFFLIDSNGKKVRFLFQTAHALGLRNVQAIHARAEGYAITPQVAIVLSRAFASVRQFVETSQHLLAPDGRLLAMKGQYPAAELAELPAEFSLAASHVLRVPGSAVTRHLLDIRRSRPTQ